MPYAFSTDNKHNFIFILFFYSDYISHSAEQLSIMYAILRVLQLAKNFTSDQMIFVEFLGIMVQPKAYGQGLEPASYCDRNWEVC